MSLWYRLIFFGLIFFSLMFHLSLTINSFPTRPNFTHIYHKNDKNTCTLSLRFICTRIEFVTLPYRVNPFHTSVLSLPLAHTTRFDPHPFSPHMLTTFFLSLVMQFCSHSSTVSGRGYNTCLHIFGTSTMKSVYIRLLQQVIYIIFFSEEQ